MFGWLLKRHTILSFYLYTAGFVRCGACLFGRKVCLSAGTCDTDQGAGAAGHTLGGGRSSPWVLPGSGSSRHGRASQQRRFSAESITGGGQHCRHSVTLPVHSAAACCWRQQLAVDAPTAAGRPPTRRLPCAHPPARSFVLTLKKGRYTYQFGQYAWTHMILMVGVTPRPLRALRSCCPRCAVPSHVPLRRQCGSTESSNRHLAGLSHLSPACPHTPSHPRPPHPHAPNPQNS